ncbi:MAG: hypothetical protein Q9209_003292 [Squamulea sp. 1 TL-2023]
MVVPLRDQHDKVRYYLGAQLDITELVNGSAGLDSLQKLVDHQNENTTQQAQESLETHNDLLTQFQQLSETFTPQELKSVLKSQQRQEMDDHVVNGFDNSNDHQPHSNSSAGSDGKIQFPGSGNAPPLGFYKNYLLVRPHPSLRILFASQDLRVPGILQSPLMDQIGGSSRVRDDLYHALEAGQKVTAKIQWLSKAFDAARTRWIHCTPLISASGLIGVWMVILVDDDEEPPVSHEQPQSEPMPTTLELSDSPEPRSWDSATAERTQQSGSSGTPSTADSSQTAVSDSAKPIFEKVPPIIKEVPETVSLPFASGKAMRPNAAMPTMDRFYNDVIYEHKPLPSPPSNTFHEHDDLRRRNDSLPRSWQQEQPKQQPKQSQQPQQQQQSRQRNGQPPDIQTFTVRPGPRIAGKAYSFDSENGLSSDDGHPSINGRGGDRPTSRDSHITVAQSSIPPTDIRWRKPEDNKGGVLGRGGPMPVNVPGRLSQDSTGSQRQTAWKTKKSLSPYGFLFND